MEGKPLETPAEGKVDVVVQERVIVEWNKTGVYFTIRACISCSWIAHWG